MQLENALRTEIEFWSDMIETRPGGAAVETIEEMVRASSLTEEKLDLLLQPDLSKFNLYDLDQVPALATERDAQWNRVSTADFLTQAEKRALLGLPAVSTDE